MTESLSCSICTVSEVGFQSALYMVVEGEQTMVTVCVAILAGKLTDDVSLDYAISAQSQMATGNIIVSYFTQVYSLSLYL